MVQQYWTREKLDQLENLHRKGYTLCQLAHHFQGTVSSISKTLTRYELRGMEGRRQSRKHKIVRDMLPHRPQQHISWNELVLWLRTMGITLVPDPTRKENWALLKSLVL